jgi:hypothetical protein
MPIPSKKQGESPKDFMSRCMSDSVMNKEFPDQSQRSSICMSKACEGLNHIEAADFQLSQSQGNKKIYKYKDPKTGEVYEFERRGLYRRNGRILVPVR